MPIMNGYESAKKIKQHLIKKKNSSNELEEEEEKCFFHDVKLVAHTSYLGLAEEEKCKGFGFDGYLVKPSTEEDFQASITEMLCDKLENREIESCYKKYKNL